MLTFLKFLPPLTIFPVKSLNYLLGLAALSGLSFAGDDPKVNYSIPVDPGDLNTEPYLFNGLVQSGDARGSGFVAENEQLFISAAHVVYDEDLGWQPAPTFIPGQNGDAPDIDGEIASRGYFRWNSYARLAQEGGVDWRATFSRDVIMAFAFEPFIGVTPPRIDYRGFSSLRRENLVFITGYPAEIDYTGESGGYYLHSTTPDFTQFSNGFGRYVTNTHLSTGPGNSGGPVWLQDRRGNWLPAGVLVSGLTAETGVYGMSPDMRQFVNTSRPLLRTPISRMRPGRGIGFSNGFYRYPRPRRVPDGRARWTRLPVRVANIDREAQVSKVILDLTIETADRSDLVVRLVAPGGTYKELHSLSDPGEADLIFEQEDVTDAFAGLNPNGNWQLYIQDRIRGDWALVREFQLEISVDGETVSTDP